MNPLASAPLPLLAGHLRGKQPLYAILDAAAAPAIPALLAAGDCQYQNLFTGERAARLADFAPYLVALPATCRLLDDLLELWDANAAIWLTAAAAPAELLAHLRDILWPQTPDGPMLWRFYDPRVLRDLLPTCDGRRATAFFGPVQVFRCAGADPDTLFEAAPTATGVAVRTLPLARLPLLLSTDSEHGI